MKKKSTEQQQSHQKVFIEAIFLQFHDHFFLVAQGNPNAKLIIQ
jgi:hypothetical protein